MHCYIVWTEHHDTKFVINVTGTLDKARRFARALQAYQRPSVYVELRDMPTDKDALVQLLRDRLMASSNFPEKVGPLLRRWNMTPRGALKEEELS